MNKVVLFSTNLVVLTLSIFSIIGLVWLTKFSFNAKVSSGNNSKACVSDFDSTKLTFSKITVVLLWIQIALVTLSSLWVSFTEKNYFE